MRRSARAIVIKDDALLVMKRNKYGQQFYALVGGGVDAGEAVEQALHREVQEEASLVITSPRLVLTIHAGQEYGIQSIYLCDYVSGQPNLSPDSEEAQSNKEGQNLYQPVWLPIKDLAEARFLPLEFKKLLLDWLENGFPNTPLTLTTQP